MTPTPGTATDNGAKGVGAQGTTQSPAAQNQTRTMHKYCTSTSKKKGSGGYRSTSVVTQTGKCPTTGCTGKEMARTVTKWSQKPRITGGALTFPFLSDTSEIFGMLV